MTIYDMLEFTQKINNLIYKKAKLQKYKGLTVPILLYIEVILKLIQNQCINYKAFLPRSRFNLVFEVILNYFSLDNNCLVLI